MNIPFCIPSVGRDEIREVSAVLKKHWLTMGQATFQFEEEFARYINAPYCVSISSCTDAMFLTLEALKHFKKTAVKTTIPSYTFTATAAVFEHAGLDYEFEDIEPETLVMKKTDKPSVPVHFGGLFNNQPNALFEDSAHRILKNSFTGTITCFSFYAIKNMTTGEGGMIALNDKAMADWLRKARLHGISADAWNRYQKGSHGVYHVEFPGWKSNMTDMQSAMGLVQLKKLDEMNEKRRILVARYNQNLESGIDREANHLYPILVNNRSGFMEHLSAKGIGYSFHFPPLHLQPAYQHKTKTLPVTEFVGERVVTLPLYPDLKLNQVDFISRQVLAWWKKYGRVE